MQSGHAHINYKVNKKKPSNVMKMQEGIKAYVKLLQRFAKEGPTKWIVNAVNTARAKMTKYNVNLSEVDKGAGFSAESLKATAPKKKAAHKVLKEGAAVEKIAAPKKGTAKKEPVKKMETKKKDVEKKVAPKKAPAKKPAAKGGKKAPTVKKPAAKKEAK